MIYSAFFFLKPLFALFHNVTVTDLLRCVFLTNFCFIPSSFALSIIPDFRYTHCSALPIAQTSFFFFLTVVATSAQGICAAALLVICRYHQSGIHRRRQDLPRTSSALLTFLNSPCRSDPALNEGERLISPSSACLSPARPAIVLLLCSFLHLLRSSCRLRRLTPVVRQRKSGCTGSSLPRRRRSPTSIASPPTPMRPATATRCSSCSATCSRAPRQRRRHR